jgi:hypothetical protein
MSRTRTYLFLVIIVLLISAGTVTGADTLTRPDIRQLTTAATSTPVPAPSAATVTCISPCQCLEYSRAVSVWGASGFFQCNELPCEVSRSVSGAPVEKFCYQQKPVAAVTTSSAFPVLTTPLNQIASPKPTIPPTPFPIPQTTPLNIAATPAAVVSTLSPGATAIGTRLRPLVIGAGAAKKVQLIGSGSPYFPAMSLPSWSNMPLTSIEVDQYNTAKQYFDSGKQFYSPPLWVDEKQVTIEKSVKNFDVNFRYLTSEKGVTAAVWQVSRYPFADDPTHWQSKYIPGLVASGPVKAHHSDADGSQYFVIDFARIARHNAGDPPYFDGVASIDQDPQGVGMVQAEVKIPLTSSVIVTKKVNLGFLSFPVPSGLITIPSGEFTQSELGNPNDGQSLICSDCLNLRAPSGIESALADMDKKYYVRIVPIRNGNGGIPAIPVEVTVSRPHPCPSPIQDVIVKPPSAKVLWYMQPNFYANPGTAESYHWYYVKADSFHPAGLHTWEPPVEEDKAWWQKVEDFFGSIINYFSDMVTGMSEAWNALQDIYVGITAKVLSYTLTFGLYHCEDHAECTGVLKAGLQAVMVAYGIPPTLPTGPELQSLSTDYLIELGADQFGAGAVYDAYKELPGDVKDKLKGNPGTVSQELANSQKGGMENASQQAYCKEYPNPAYVFDNSLSKNLTFCNYKIPDPIFNAVHPATVMVYVTNPNADTTDRMILEVTDSMGLYNKATAIIPPIEGGKGFGVPVVLTENYARFKKINGGTCDTDNTATVTFADGSLAELPCPQAKWMELWKSGWVYGQNHPLPDTFTVTFATSATSCGAGSCPQTSGLTPQSSGKQLNTVLVMDPGAPGGACPTDKYIRYPQGWQMTTQGKSVASFTSTWDPDMFTGSTSGTLRNSP